MADGLTNRVAVATLLLDASIALEDISRRLATTRTGREELSAELDEFSRDARWSGLHPVFAAATPSQREQVCKVLLDFMRRELCVGHDSAVDRIAWLGDDYDYGYE